MNKKYKPPFSAAFTLSLLTVAASIILFIAAAKSIVKSVLHIAAAVLISLDVIVLIYISLSMKKICIHINEKTVILESGIIISNERRANRSAIELAYIIKTPFSKYTGINFTVLCVYGSMLVLPFLSIKDAEEILNIVCGSISNKEEAK